MARQFGDLDELAVGRAAGDLHAVLRKHRLVLRVEFEAMAMPFVDQARAVCTFGHRPRRELAGVFAEPHRPAEFVDPEEIAQLEDDLRRRVRVALGRIGIGKSGNIARVLDRGPLESVADAEVRDLLLARDFGGLHHAARAAIAEAAGHENTVRVIEQCGAIRFFERLRLDPLDVDLQPMREAAVIERLVQALV